ncbi:MAG: hypothetical protein KDG50_12175 [Chromatiales bacterium]|nr:hypothetical protein [Chromatiales bacterium]
MNVLWHAMTWAFALLTLFAGAASAAELLVVNKSGASVTALDPRNGATLRSWPTAPGPHEVAVSPDGARAVVAEYGPDRAAGNSLLLIELASGAPSRIDLGDHRRPHGLAWLDDRRLLVSIEASAAVLIVDTTAGRIEAVIPTAQALPHMLAVDSGRNRAYVSSIVDGDVAVIDLATHRVVSRIPTGAGAEGVAVHPATGIVWVVNRAAGTLSLIDPDSLAVVRSGPAGEFPIRVAFDSTGTRALVSDAAGGRVLMFSTPEAELIGAIDVRGYYDLANGISMGGWLGRKPVPIGLIAAPGSVGTAFVALAHGGVVLELDLDRLQVRTQWRAGAEPDGLALTGGR